MQKFLIKFLISIKVSLDLRRLGLDLWWFGRNLQHFILDLWQKNGKVELKALPLGRPFLKKKVLKWIDRHFELRCWCRGEGGGNMMRKYKCLFRNQFVFCNKTWQYLLDGGPALPGRLHQFHKFCHFNANLRGGKAKM